jgi:hypothetical protein
MNNHIDIKYKTIDPLIGLALVLIYFFTVNEYLPSIIYTSIACLAALYHFPFRAMQKSPDNEGSKWQIVNKLSFPVIASVIMLSVAMLFVPEEPNTIQTIVGIVGILNGLLIWIHYFTGSSKYYVIMHFIYAFLSAGSVLQ